MDKYLNKIMIVDGSYFLHRSMHTPDLKDLETSKGVKSGGVYGFLRILQAEVKKFPSYFPIVCFDKGLSERRTALYPDYKANRRRQEADKLIALNLNEEDNYLEEYRRQRSDVIQILKALGIPALLLPGWEGDDLQYLLSKVCKEAVVVSDDKDMIQLVAPNVKVRRSMLKETIEWETCDRYYCHPRFTIRKAIVGDGSDNIPKCAPGVGDKGADQVAQLIENVPYEDYRKVLEEYCENNSNALSKKVQKVLDCWDQFIVNYQLIDLRLVESPVGFERMIKDLITMVVGHSNVMRAYSLIGQYEMTTIYPDQIIGMIAPSSSQVLLKG